MPNIEVYRTQFDSPQAAGVNFPVTVRVENHETVAPLWGDAKCETSGIGGHRVEVTISVEDESGSTVRQRSEEVCAPIQSLVVPNASAQFDLSLSEGTYYLQADAEAIGADGHHQGDPHRLEIEDDSSVVDEGGDDGSGTGINLPGDGEGGGGDVLAAAIENPLPALLVVAFVWAIIVQASDSVVPG